ncbi:MAG TPA: AMP-binding protein, partial [Polyangiales bacterium]|nr:AMP-binding protein [Polyangiales bacterium]
MAERDIESLLEASRAGMYVAYWAKLLPDATALIGRQGHLSYAEFNAQCNRLAHALRALGMKAGDALALLAPNSFEFAITLMATRRIGIRTTPLNVHLGADEIGYILRDCDARAFVASARYAEVARSAARNAPALQILLASEGDIDGFRSFDATLAGSDASDVSDPVLGMNMLYTSGSTGKPKGVERASAAPPAVAPLPWPGSYRPGLDRHLCTGPLYHAAPLGYSLVIPMLSGAGIVLMDGWDAEETLRAIETHRVSHTHMVPTMFHRLLALPKETRARYDVSSLVFVLHGAAPCPVPLKHAMIAWLGPIVYEYYGATEGIGTFVDSATWLQKPGTVGHPQPPDQIRVLDDDGRDVPSGVTGSIYLKTLPGAGFRYHKDDDKTRAAFRGEYFTLYDVGYLDEDGYLFLTDRSANLIISGGVNIYPAEADAVLITHPAVLDIGVIGVPNSEWGEEVKAVVELREGFAPSPELAQEMIEFCRARLAHYKCPRS